MTITRFEINNFGVYAGDQVIDLGAASPNKPIVLIGGENGRGKTTLLEALFLVLYGRLSPLFASSGKSYQHYLESRINTQKGLDRGASLSVELRLQTAEGLERLDVFRGWTHGDPRQTERFSVKRGGKKDEWLTNNWGTYWTEILPPNIAELFFFDGERIESLADTKTSARVVKDSVYALFGLAPITRLRADLAIVEKKSIRETDKKVSPELHDAFHSHKRDQERLEELQQYCVDLEQKRAAFYADLQRVKKKLLSLGGGSDMLKNRVEYKGKLQELKDEADRLDIRLRELAATEAPFLLVGDLLDRTMDSITAENRLAENDYERSLAKRYRQEILDQLSSSIDNEILSKVNTAIDRFFDNKITSLSEGNRQYVFPKSLRELSNVWTYTKESLTETGEQVGLVLKRRDVVAEKIHILESRLEALPAEEAVQDLLDEEQRRENELEEITVKLREANEQRDSTARVCEESRRRYTRVAETELKKHNANEDTLRIVTHAQRTQVLLDQLEHRLVRKHLSKLEIELSEKLAMLHSKRLVENVRILPDSFEIELSTAGGKKTPASRLSAGERQLLALAVLWAVQSYSEKKMPMIVDTPLGRLDSKHRKNMVERFLTEASHQTIVLSTDSEVTPELVDGVRDYIGAQYLLEYHDHDQSTRIVSGYFSEIEEGAEYEPQLV
jgi:DNA sulfur modification protein DndD